MASDSSGYSDDLRRIDELCNQFEEEIHSGGVPIVDEYLAKVREELRPQLRHELELLLSELRAVANDKTDVGESPGDPHETRYSPRSPKGDSRSHIEGYRIIRKLGAGGMGTVFLAEQFNPIRRNVAVKVIKKGMDSEQVMARFEAERQALAMMDHPNIARVFDAGLTSEGQPFFSMEYVDGVPLTDYCDEHQLDLRRRLELFVQVCNAVQHAHQKGIIHRDLKPANILVARFDDKATVKVIDFGLAKAVQGAITEQTLTTRFGQLMGTLAYMSPEQSQGNPVDIDTRTDVYSLGVVLYELLTGSTPLGKNDLRSQALDLVLQMIREHEAPRPSSRLINSADSLTITQRRNTDSRQLGSVLRGDLDWIAMKALEKDRNRRYASISALGDDVLRFLRHEPIEARPPSFGYRFRKGARKYRRTFITATAMLTLLILGLIGTMTGWIQALRLAELTELRRRFDVELLETSRPMGSLTADQTTSLVKVADSMNRLDEEEAEKARRRAINALNDSLKVRVNAQRLGIQQIDQLKLEINQLEASNLRLGSPLAREQITQLTTRLESRRRDWRPEWSTSMPPNEEELTELAEPGLVLNASCFELQEANRHVSLKKEMGDARNLQLTAEVTRGLDTTTWVGLTFNEQDNGVHYRFVLSTAPLQEPDDQGGGLPVLEDSSAPHPQLLTAILQRQPMVMSIVRSGSVLTERLIVLDQPAVKLTARREHDSLEFVVNGSHVLNFEDAFPIPRSQGSGPGILWPRGVAIAKFEIQSQPLESANPSLLERADASFANRDLDAAESLYSQVDSDEARFKSAVCLKRMRRLVDAKRRFQAVAEVTPSLVNGQPSSRWQLLSALHLLELTKERDPAGYQRSIDLLTGLYRERADYIFRVAPRNLRQQLLAFLQKDGSRWRIAIRSRGDLAELELAVELNNEGGNSPKRIRATRWRLADAYRFDGKRTQAIAILDKLLEETVSDRETDREYAAIFSDRCWVDLANGDNALARARLEALLENYTDVPLPVPLSYVLVDLARVQIIEGAFGQAANSMRQYFDIAQPAEISHGEFVEACLVAGLAESKLGNDEAAREIWQRGLRRKWTGSLQELENRSAAFGVSLVDAQKTIDGEGIIEPLAGERSTKEVFRGIQLDIEEAGIPSTKVIKGFFRFVFRPLVRDVTDNLFAFPGGTELREKIILHQLTMREQYRITVVSIIYQGILFHAFANENLSAETRAAAYSVCEDLVNHYDDERLDPGKHFGMIVQACMGAMSEETWEDLQTVLSPRVATGIAMVQAQQLIRGGSQDAQRYLNFIVTHDAAPGAFKDWASQKLSAMDENGN